MKIRVILAGATGKTGSAVARVISAEKDIEIVGAVGHRTVGQDLGVLLGLGANGIIIQSDLEALLADVEADVLLDFTTPQTAGGHAITAALAGVRPVVGTTGIPQEQLDRLAEICVQKNQAAAVISNFSYGAMLMTEFCERAVQLFPDVEIIERHHKTKIDAPSGTARTIAQSLKKLSRNSDIPIHSIRLPGVVAHHEVVFGGLGESLTIKHDTVSRESFAAGVLLVIRKIERLHGLYFDLREIMRA